MIGAARSIVQLFAYEIPLLLSILAAALLAGTWSLSAVTSFYAHHLGYLGFNALGFVVAIVALLGKLELVPFDIPEAETEIVAGSFTEYSGRLLALFRLAKGVELVVGTSLVASVFFPVALDFGPIVGFVAYVLEVLLLVAIISLLRSLAARFRIDQMINLSWKVAAPLAFAQVLISLAVKEALHL
jgi:NADH-quinone oxidoreductase subunit H